MVDGCREAFRRREVSPSCDLDGEAQGRENGAGVGDDVMAPGPRPAREVCGSGGNGGVGGGNGSAAGSVCESGQSAGDRASRHGGQVPLLAELAALVRVEGDVDRDEPPLPAGPAGPRCTARERPRVAALAVGDVAPLGFVEAGKTRRSDVGGAIWFY